MSARKSAKKPAKPAKESLSCTYEISEIIWMSDWLEGVVKVKGLDGEALVKWHRDGMQRKVTLFSEGDYLWIWPVPGVAGIAVEFIMEVDIRESGNITFHYGPEATPYNDGF